MAKTKRAFATKKAVVTKPKNTTLEKRTEKKLKKQHTLQKLELKKHSDKEHEQLLLKRKMIKPPYQVLLDTNFILHSIKKKLQLSDLTTRTYISNVTLNIPRCVFAELEKLKNTVAIKILNSVRHNKLICDHKGNYADDCIINRATVSKCYVVATSDKALRCRLRNANVPVVFVRGYKYEVEGMFL